MNELVWLLSVFHFLFSPSLFSLGICFFNSRGVKEDFFTSNLYRRRIVVDKFAKTIDRKPLFEKRKGNILL